MYLHVMDLYRMCSNHNLWVKISFELIQWNCTGPSWPSCFACQRTVFPDDLISHSTKKMISSFLCAEILDSGPKLKSYANDKEIVDQLIGIVSEMLKNYVGKEENPCYQEFSLFRKCFQNPPYLSCYNILLGFVCYSTTQSGL